MKIAEFLESEPGIDGWETKLTVTKSDWSTVYKNVSAGIEELRRLYCRDMYVTTANIVYDFRKRTIQIDIVAQDKEITFEEGVVYE